MPREILPRRTPTTRFPESLAMRLRVDERPLSRSYLLIASSLLTDDTRKCFRDTFYRLAKNSHHKSESEFLEDRTSRYRNQKTELETNSIDRAVANLTVNKMESNMRNMHPPKMR
ncbi:unnamed protein product [Brassica oleracea var. botrytis]|uniref:(rape) hypothetical protein n=1 Tax=Brassica napus TaxID=3708 RepID=A0A816HZ69_BRANA|nr:unnamed protein product [Brassica napus]